ncbi:hypothetical protein GcM3_187040, partial [Golovinomyces cichoracearum]
EKGSAQFNNQKLGLKEELRELDRREGRCYYCHQKGHLTNLCKKKIVAEGSISNLECSARTTNDDVMKIFEATIVAAGGANVSFIRQRHKIYYISYPCLNDGILLEKMKL